uniref:Putative baseplate protein n=1 Tax=viral metagenome TaxID=1070528 RepID=A0A6H1Z9B7_9ZZZZ
MPTPPLLPTEPTNYTGLNHRQLLARLQALFQQVRPEWSDFSSNHPENLLLQGTTLIGGLLAGSSDERYRQTMWALITDRLAAIRKGAPIGFELTGRAAGALDGYFSTAGGIAAPQKILIPAGARVMCGQAIYTSTVDMDVAAAAISSITASLENWELQTDVVQSDEVANFPILLVETPVIDGSVGVVAGNGAFVEINPTTGLKWKSFLEMGPDTKGFITMQDNNGHVYVLFGSGVNGVVPTGTVTVTYHTGGGETGKISSVGATWTVLDSIFDDLGNEVNVVFTNTTVSLGEADEMSVEEAKVRGPLAARTNKRCVNEPDFEYAATTVAGLARAALLTSEHDSSIPEDYGRLYLVARGAAYTGSGYYPPAAPSATQIAAVQALIDEDTGEYPQLMLVSVSVLAAIFFYIHVKVRVYKEANYSAATVKANITAELQKWFSVADQNRGPLYNSNWGYKLLGTDGYPDYKIPWSKLFNVVNDTAGVREVSSSVDGLLLNDLRASVVLEPAKFCILGNIQVYDMDQGGLEI